MLNYKKNGTDTYISKIKEILLFKTFLKYFTCEICSASAIRFLIYQNYIMNNINIFRNGHRNWSPSTTDFPVLNHAI